MGDIKLEDMLSLNSASYLEDKMRDNLVSGLVNFGIACALNYPIEGFFTTAISMLFTYSSINQFVELNDNFKSYMSLRTPKYLSGVE